MEDNCLKILRLYKWLGEASGQTTLNPLDQRWAQTLSRSSVTAGVAVFPIGIGDQYDAAQLRVLAGPGASSNVAELQRIEDLPSMVALATLSSRGYALVSLVMSLLSPQNRSKSSETHLDTRRFPYVRFGLELRLLYRP